jgi:hypothetical protein
MAISTLGSVRHSFFADSQRPLHNRPTVRSTCTANQQTSPASEP